MTALIRLTIALALCITINLCFAVEVQQGQIYSGETKIESSELGLSFTIPAQWQGAWPAGSEFFILESQSLQANIFVFIDELSESDLKALMSQSIPLDHTLSLAPTTAPTKFGNIIRGSYSVPGNPELSGYIEAKSGLGKNSVAFIAITHNSNLPAIKDITAYLSKSLSYQKPNPVIETKGGEGSWQQYLTGRHLVRLYTGSGYSEEEHIYLCSNGSFYRTTNAGGFGGGASGAFGGKGQGTWGAKGNANAKGTLILQYGAGSVSTGSGPGFDWSESGPGGEQLSYSVELYQGKLYLNDTKWFRDGNNYCN